MYWISTHGMLGAYVEIRKGFSLSLNKRARQMSHQLKHGLVCAMQMYAYGSGSVKSEPA